MLAYSTKIPGTPAYWFSNRQNIESCMEQMNSPTFFFTLSFADLHHPELKRLLFCEKETKTNIFKKINMNPHIVDWFFFEKVKKFTNFFLKTL